MSTGLEAYRQRLRDRVARWVSEEILNHIIFNGSTLYQNIELVNSQAEADNLMHQFAEKTRMLPDLTRNEKHLLKLLDQTLERR